MLKECMLEFNMQISVCHVIVNEMERLNKCSGHKLLALFKKQLGISGPRVSLYQRY